jgi:hypothetical protein
VPEGIGGKGNGVRLGDKEAVTYVNDGGVLAHTRPNEHTRIRRHVLCQKGSQEGSRELTRWERDEIHTVRL